MSLPESAPGAQQPPRDEVPRRGAAIGLWLAALTGVSFLVLGATRYHLNLGLAGAASFAAWFAWGARGVLRRPRILWTDVLPWFIFAAPAMTVLLALFGTPRSEYLIGLRELSQVGGTLLVAHLLLRRVAAAARDAPAGEVELPNRLMLAWIVIAWGLSTAFLLVRFQLYQAAGHPEDTAFLWDCFRHWRAGQGPISPWVVTWGHRFPTHYFALHYSPALYLFFGVARLLPHLATLLVLQNLCVMAAFLIVARTLARPGTTRPEQFRGATLWGLGLILASPPLNSALRTDLHPILWALPLLALAHFGYDRRRPLLFLVSGLLLFTLREDLGWVWGMYAPLAWLEGRRRGADAFWLLTPLIGFIGTLIIQQAVIPRFGAGDSAFFQMVFGTEARGLIAFMISMFTHPLDLFRRLLRPGNLLLFVQLLATGIAHPVGSWRWLPGLALAGIFSLVEPGTQLLRMSGHYVVVPALFLVVSGLGVLLPRLARVAPAPRLAWLIALWVLGLCQPSDPELPGLRALLRFKQTRSEIAADLALLDPQRPAWLPGNLLLAAPRPELAVPIHRMAVRTMAPDDPGMPTQALLPVNEEVAAGKIAMLSEPGAIFTRTAHGHFYDLYEAVRR